MSKSDRPGLAQRLAGQVRGGLLNLGVAQCARLIGVYLDGFGDPGRAVSPQGLETAITSGRNPILDAVAAASPQQIATVRTTFRSIAGDFRRLHTCEGRVLGHPYMWVLQEDVLSRDHPEHVAVILRHQQQYRELMDRALDWLFGSGSAQR